MALTNSEIDLAVPTSLDGKPSRALMNAALKELAADVAAANGAVSSITYTGGQVTAIAGVGWSGSATYDGLGRILTYTENGVTRTATYNLDGTLASFQ